MKKRNAKEQMCLLANAFYDDRLIILGIFFLSMFYFLGLLSVMAPGIVIMFYH